ncbi:hypothetical protein [Pseudoalteromonas sp. 20-MNA-CIBAN-0454]|uniref:hypothetical protein n=1 Tax=Pseudoalteromonas sp. 20-MNA-CIBAN-0454 TaxID=3140424 RepID=UPI003318F5DD
MMNKDINKKEKFQILVIVSMFIVISIVIFQFSQDFPYWSNHINAWTSTANIFNGLISPILLFFSVILIWLTWRTSEEVLQTQKNELKTARLEHQLIRFGRHAKQLHTQIKTIDLLPEKTAVRGEIIKYTDKDSDFKKLWLKHLSCTDKELGSKLAEYFVNTPLFIYKCIEVYNRLRRGNEKPIDVKKLIAESNNIDESVCELIGEALSSTLQNKNEFKDFIRLMKQNIDLTESDDSYFRDEYIAELTLNFDKKLIKELLQYDLTLSQDFKVNLNKYL